MGVDARDLIAADFLDDVGGGIILNACVVVEVLQANGDTGLISAWTDGMAFYAREGMVLSLLRDVTAVPKAAVSENAHQQLHDDEDE